MNPYEMLGSGSGTQEAALVRARLTAWHDAMVEHERRLRAVNSGERCDDECPHADARLLWPEALATFGPGATDLVFLRTRALNALRRPTPNATLEARAAEL
jgi:hypothetical protein